MFKNIKIGKKLGMGFGVILFMLLVVSWNNYSSFQNIGEMSVTAQNASSNQAFSIEKEVDHLKWMAALANLFLDENVTKVTVATDDHKCGLGKWMYSDETKQMCAEDPQLKAIIEKMMEPHHSLHASAINIDEKYVSFDMELKTLLAGRWIDHLNWVKHVANSNLTQTTFDGGLDPHQCAFGKWYYGYTSKDPEFGALMKKWEEPHTLLHESAQKMVQAQKAGDWKEAKRIYQNQTLLILSHLEDCYHGTYNWMNETAAKQEAAFAIYNEHTSKAVAETQTYLAELKEHFSNQSEAATSETNASIGSSITVMSIMVAVAILIGIGAAFIITRGITKPIGKVVELTNQMNDEFEQFVGVVDAIANNDLTQEIKHSEIADIVIKSKDEIGTLVEAIKGTLDSKTKIGESMTRMTENLATMIRRLLDNAAQLVTAANEISSSSEEMATGAKNQTEQAAQVSTAIEEMTATIMESSKNANEAKEVSEGAAGTSAEGQEIVGNTISGMVKIAESADESGRIINELAQASDKIGEIIGVIDDIADQTNLLALNAAIEAARAGEQGRGFAVVADEVRKLAERTGTATGEITEMIKGIQADSGRAVTSMEEAGKLVEEGKGLADKAGNSLNEINAMTQRVTDMIIQIATAADQQSAAAEQISKNMEHITSITKETATGADQSASAAEQLNRQAEGLQQMVSVFKVKENA